MAAPRRPALVSDDWMLEQQVRAEMEAEAWRRLRAHMAAPVLQLPAPEQEAPLDHHREGSAILKAIVRSAMALFGAYLGWLAAVDARLGEFEAWLAAGAGFLITLSLSMFGYARDFVHVLAETARWAIIAAVAIGAVWMIFQVA